ncbi:DUF6055 domain-containing protein, partial [Candidatus Sumerlaeota bacterium]
MRTQMKVMMAVALLSNVALAADYDFYGRMRYPGPELRPDVELYQVDQRGSGEPRAYERRDVDWWPRKGVDVIEVQQGMPLRAWTLRRGPIDPVADGDVEKPTVARLDSLESAKDIGDSFFRRIYGYLYPPQTGEYTFMISADDSGALYLSTDEDPKNKKRIAGLSENARPKQWDKRPGQISLPIRLEAGKKYYLEATHEEIKWGDHVAVAWEGPGVSIAIIAGEYLSDIDGKRGGITEELTMIPEAGNRQLTRAPRQFDAHLIGFRGMGNTMSSKFGGDGGPIEPAVVLRLADGRKRFFPRGSFGEVDKKYIMDLYVKEMKRIKAGLDKSPRGKRPGGDIKFPNNAKPGEPGTMQVESEHFIWLSGSQAGSDGDPWVNAKEPDKAQWFRDGSIECAEYFWALSEYIGHLMPFWDGKDQVKYEITVPGTKRDGYKVIPGFAGGGYGGCGIKGAGGGPWASALFHEWGHGVRGGWGLGGGEALADTHQTLADPGTMKGNHHIKAPWRNVFNGDGGYGFTVFYNVTGDDPNWGYGWYTSSIAGLDEWSVLQTLARAGEQRGLFKNGIRGMGDMVGEYGARLATFDCELEDVYRRNYFAPNRNWLEPVDADKRIYRIPWEEAPEPFGVNIVRLVADERAKKITVDFTGLHDPDFYSDWRACIIAVQADGQRRYSKMWNKGKMTMKRQDGDQCYWLTVAATPTALFVGAGNDRRDSFSRNKLYSGRHAYRYPWSVRLDGARPGTPRESRADLADAQLLYKIEDSVPAPRDTTAGAKHLIKLTAFIEHLTTAKARLSGQPALLARVSDLQTQAQAELARTNKGARHARGGGWVAATANVAPTAYVGPHAMVLGNARVLDQAIIEDYAIVSGDAVVSGHARLGGQAVVKDKAKADGYSRVWGAIGGSNVATVVPKRPGADKPDQFGLWANYAMDRDEKTMLEDWYRYAFSADRGYAELLGPNLNGYLVGRPEFVTDGERRGFRFGGKGQHGELSPRLADFGELTVELAITPEGQGAQTIFDFGSSTKNCFTLRTARNGRPELVATVGGKVVARAAAKLPLPQNEWVSLRVELDGKKAALWINGVKAAEQATTFRPCDAFPGGAAKRNFLAASRDGSDRFKGIVDRVVVYHAVHDDFAKAPPPLRDSPTRPTAEFVESLKIAYGNIEAVNRKVNAMSGEMMKPYKELEKQKDARELELKERSPEFVKARAALEAAKAAAEQRKQELAEQFSKLPESVKLQQEMDAMRKQIDDMRKQVQQLERERLDADKELAAAQPKRKEFEDQRRAAEQKLNGEFKERP